MANGKAQSISVSSTTLRSRHWRQTVSGVTVLTLGLQGTAVSAVDVSVPFISTDDPSTDTLSDKAANIPDAVPSSGVALEASQRPQFSPMKWRPLQATRQPSVSLSLDRLKQHRRELHRRSNDVEFQLLGLQQLLSLQAYGNSFADRLLAEDDAYQTKLQQVQKLEIEIHAAIERADTDRLNQLQPRLRHIDETLRSLAQQRLQQHIEQAQSESISGLWQEPMYRSSLEWLMEYTHERHLLKARQQTLARMLVAAAE